MELKKWNGVVQPFQVLNGIYRTLRSKKWKRNQISSFLHSSEWNGTGMVAPYHNTAWRCGQWCGRQDCGGRSKVCLMTACMTLDLQTATPLSSPPYMATPRLRLRPRPSIADSVGMVLKARAFAFGLQVDHPLSAHPCGSKSSAESCPCLFRRQCSSF